MAKGKKTGGRTKGTPNKDRASLVEKLEELGCDPITEMAKIAMEKENDINLRSKMFAEIAQYVCPKLRSTDLKVGANDEMKELLDTIWTRNEK